MTMYYFELMRIFQTDNNIYTYTFNLTDLEPTYLHHGKGIHINIRLHFEDIGLVWSLDFECSKFFLYY